MRATVAGAGAWVRVLGARACYRVRVYRGAGAGYLMQWRSKAIYRAFKRVLRVSRGLLSVLPLCDCGRFYAVLQKNNCMETQCCEKTTGWKHMRTRVNPM